jgi:FtsZ-binding cell division protein ZapB
MKDTILQYQKDIEELQDKNDDLQKEADKVKDLENQVDQLKKEKEDLIDKNAELVLKQSSSSSSR